MSKICSCLSKNCNLLPPIPFYPLRRWPDSLCLYAERHTERGGSRQVASRSEDGEANCPVEVDDVDKHCLVVQAETCCGCRNDEVDAETHGTTDTDVVLEHRITTSVIRILYDQQKRT